MKILTSNRARYLSLLIALMYLVIIPSPAWAAAPALPERFLLVGSESDGKSPMDYNKNIFDRADVCAWIEYIGWPEFTNYTLEWYKNGELLSYLAMKDTISSEQTTPGDVWKCVFTLWNGQDSITVSAQANIVADPSVEPPVFKLPAVNSDNHFYVVEGQSLKVIISAIDVNPKELPITYLDPRMPDGASIDPVSRLFTWQTVTGQGGKTYTLKFRATNGLKSVALQEITVEVITPMTSVDLQAYMPPVGDQGAIGSCCSWSTGYYYKTFQEGREHPTWDLNEKMHQCNPMFIYNEGMVAYHNKPWLILNGDVLLSRGCVPLGVMPQTRSLSIVPTSDQYEAGMPWRANSQALNPNMTIDMMRQHLSQGDLLSISIYMYTNEFSSYGNGDNNVYDGGRGLTNIALHALTVVGFDDSREYTNENGQTSYGAFKVVNSWSSYWEKGGYVWISYDSFHHDVCQFWSLTDRINYHPKAIAIYHSNKPINVMVGTMPLSIKAVANLDYRAEGAIDITDAIDKLPPSQANKWFLRADIATLNDPGEVLLDLFKIKYRASVTRNYQVFNAADLPQKISAIGAGATNYAYSYIDGSEARQYTLTLTTTESPEGNKYGSIKVTPDKAIYTSGEDVQLQAIANDGYSFTGWTGLRIPQPDNPLNLKMDSDKIITANFVNLNPIPTVSLTAPVNGATAYLNEGVAFKMHATGGSGSYMYNIFYSNENGAKSIDFEGAERTLILFSPNKAGVVTVTYWVKDSLGRESLHNSITLNVVSKAFTLNVVNFDSKQGTVTKTPDLPTYDYGATVQLTAAENEGYNFTGWSGDVTDSAKTISITIDNNKTITANFAPESRSLRLYVLNGGSVTITSSKKTVTITDKSSANTFSYGEELTLTANPDSGYEFASWVQASDNPRTTILDNPRRLAMDTDKVISAHFTKKAVLPPVVTLSSITPSDGENVYLGKDTSFNLAATGGSGKYEYHIEFGDGKGSISLNNNDGGQRTFSHIYNALRKFTLEYWVVDSEGKESEHKSSSITVVYQPGGQVSIGSPANGANVIVGENANFTAQIQGGISPYQYVWEFGDGDTGVVNEPANSVTTTYKYSTSGSYTVNLTVFDAQKNKSVAPPITVNAVQSSIIHYLDLYILGKGSVTITSSNKTVTITENSSPTFKNGEKLTLTAIPAPGYEFTLWNQSTDNPRELIMDTDKVIYAQFTKQAEQEKAGSMRIIEYTNSQPLTVRVSWDSPSGGTGPYAYELENSKDGQNFSLLCKPTDFTYVVDKYVNSNGVSESLLNGGTYYYRVTAVNTRTNKRIPTNVVSLTFKSFYTITVNSSSLDNAQHGSVARDPNKNNYTSGESVTLTATADTGYKFSGWSGDIQGITNPVTITVDTNKTITANFAPESRSLRLYVLNGGSVTITSSKKTVTITDKSSANTFSYGEELTLTANPDSGYEFASWVQASDNPRTTILDNPRRLAMDTDKVISAHFTKKAVLPPVVTLSSITPSDGENVYLGKDTSFNLAATGGSGKYEYHIEFGDGKGSISLNNNDGGQRTFSHIYNALRKFTLEYWVVDSEGKESEHKSSSITVVYQPGGQVSIGSPANGANVIVGENANFTAQIQGGISPYQYVWEFGDGDTGVVNEPANSVTTTYKYSTSGSYTVNLTVFDAQKNKSVAPPITVNAVQSSIIHYLDLYILGKGSVTITSSNKTVTITENSSPTFKNGEKLTLTAIPDPGYEFTLWNQSTDNPRELIMDTDKVIYAQFTKVSIISGTISGDVPVNPPLPVAAPVIGTYPKNNADNAGNSSLAAPAPAVAATVLAVPSGQTNIVKQNVTIATFQVPVLPAPKSLPEVIVTESKRPVTLAKVYKLDLPEIKDKPVHWELSEGSKLPNGLKLNKKKGTIEGEAREGENKRIELDLLVTTKGNKTIKAHCAFEIQN